MNLLEQRKEQLLKLFTSGDYKKFNLKLLYPILFFSVILLSLWIRTRNLGILAGKYLIELDSYFFYRLAKTITETGSLPDIDPMRYAPIGYQTAPYKFFALTLSKFYEFTHFFAPHLTQIEWHIYYPPVITAISFIFLFLLLREIFDSKIALVSTAFLAVIPGYIQRTSAGFADHEAMALLWMFLSLWLFVMMWKSDDIKRILIFAAASGIFAGFMVMTWGGFRFLTLTIGIFFIIVQLFSKITQKQFIGYIVWFIPFIAAWNFQFYQGFSLGMFTSLENMVMIFGILLYITIILLKKTKIFDLTHKYIPIEFTSAALVTIIGLIIVIGFGIINFGTLIEPLLSISETATASTRFGFTVSESQNPYFFGASGWWSNFGFTMLFGFLGSVLMAYNLFAVKIQDTKIIEKLKQNKLALLAAAIYASFFLVFVFARLSTQPEHQKIVQFFSGTYLYWVFLLLGAFIGIYLYIYKTDKFTEIFTAEKTLLLLIFVLFMLSLLTSRGQIRILFMFAPVICIATSYFVVNATQFMIKGDKIWKILAVVLIILTIFSFQSAAAASIEINKYTGSMIPGQWDQAMTFLREQTPEGSVVTHWWDYGYMTQSIGERPSVTDGGNVRPWNHASGRYFLTGKDDTTTLEYFKTHNVSYFLISKEEIPKYHAFSFIGSDENFDRQSTIGTFVLNDKKEIRDGVTLIYTGGWGLDKTYKLNDIVLTPDNAGIFAFSITLDNSSKVATPYAYVTQNNQQYQMSISCLYINNQKIEFPVTQPYMPGCLVLVPYYQSDTQVLQTGGALWLSEKVWDTNMAKLYIYGEDNPNFELVYSDATPLGYYQGQLIGPIKIWNVNYPDNIQPNPKYLEESKYG